MSKTLIHNIGTILSGDFENPILAGDTACTDGDKIVFIGDRAAAPALAALITPEELSADYIIPKAFDPRVGPAVAAAVAQAARESGVARI